MINNTGEETRMNEGVADTSAVDRLVLDTEHEALRRLRPWLNEMLGDLDDPTVGRIELAVHELAANIVDHANPPDRRMEIHLERRLAVVTLTLSDQGRPPRLDALQQPHPRVRGYGMMIVEELSSTFGHVRTDGWNVWTLAFTTE